MKIDRTKYLVVLDWNEICQYYVDAKLMRNTILYEPFEAKLLRNAEQRCVFELLNDDKSIVIIPEKWILCLAPIKEENNE